MKKILIIDDDDAQRILYEIEISEMGYEVILAKNGMEALKKMSQQKPDVVVLDLMLPGMDGIELLRKILGTYPEVPVIIHTAYSHYKDKLLSWAADAYIIKSSDLTRLKNAIQMSLSAKTLDNYAV